MPLEEADGASARGDFGSDGEADDSGPDDGYIDVCHAKIIWGNWGIG
jgi:hypothetical protein